jgi:hypothetical protein
MLANLNSLLIRLATVALMVAIVAGTSTSGQAPAAIAQHLAHRSVPVEGIPHRTLARDTSPRFLVGAGAGLAQADCANLRAGPVAWALLADAGDIDREVAAYPSGAREIAPVFEYACVPKNTTIVTVFSYNGEVVLTDKETLTPSGDAGLYSYPLMTDDGSPLADGEWKAAFYSDGALLTSGVVPVGGQQATEAVAVRGTVRDSNTRKPVRGALVAIVKPGISVSTFLDSGRESDLYVSATTDGLGQFSLSRPLPRGATYGLLVVAKGYRPIAEDNFAVGPGQPNPLTMDIVVIK